MLSMRQNIKSVIIERSNKVTTNRNHKFNIAPNLLNRNFATETPNQKWCVDSANSVIMGAGVMQPMPPL